MGPDIRPEGWGRISDRKNGTGYPSIAMDIARYLTRRIGPDYMKWRNRPDIRPERCITRIMGSDNRAAEWGHIYYRISDWKYGTGISARTMGLDIRPHGLNRISDRIVCLDYLTHVWQDILPVIWPDIQTKEWARIFDRKAGVGYPTGWQEPDIWPEILPGWMTRVQHMENYSVHTRTQTSYTTAFTFIFDYLKICSHQNVVNWS